LQEIVHARRCRLDAEVPRRGFNILQGDTHNCKIIFLLVRLLLV
jgi:hypothetical protein